MAYSIKREDFTRDLPENFVDFIDYSLYYFFASNDLDSSKPYEVFNNGFKKPFNNGYYILEVNISYNPYIFLSSKGKRIKIVNNENGIYFYAAYKNDYGIHFINFENNTMDYSYYSIKTVEEVKKVSNDIKVQFKSTNLDFYTELGYEADKRLKLNFTDYLDYLSRCDERYSKFIPALIYSFLCEDNSIDLVNYLDKKNLFQNAILLSLKNAKQPDEYREYLKTMNVKEASESDRESLSLIRDMLRDVLSTIPVDDGVFGVFKYACNEESFDGKLIDEKDMTVSYGVAAMKVLDDLDNKDADETREYIELYKHKYPDLYNKFIGLGVE